MFKVMIRYFYHIKVIICRFESGHCLIHTLILRNASRFLYGFLSNENFFLCAPCLLVTGNTLPSLVGHF